LIFSAYFPGCIFFNDFDQKLEHAKVELQGFGYIIQLNAFTACSTSITSTTK
jgi:hypothetical protein